VSVRNNAPVADVPGAQLRFNKADAAQAPPKGAFSIISAST